MACRASAAAENASPQLTAQPGIDIATVATAGDHHYLATTFSEQLSSEIDNFDADAPSLFDLPPPFDASHGW
jgi:hypothetical protein